MLKHIQSFWDRLSKKDPNLPTKPSTAESILLLLLEIAWVDHNISEEEEEHIQQLIKPFLTIKDPAPKELIANAKLKFEKSTGIQQHTRTLIQELPFNQRQTILLALWEIAYLDNHSSPEEEHTLRKISDLLYLPHSEFIRCKQLSRQKMKKLSG